MSTSIAQETLDPIVELSMEATACVIAAKVPKPNMTEHSVVAVKTSTSTFAAGHTIIDHDH